MELISETRTTFADPERRLGSIPSVMERRELVAHWMSDIHAVPDHPALRRIHDGTLFHIDDLMDALRSLDETAEPRRNVLPFDRRPPQGDDDDPKPGAGAMWPSIPPDIVDARAPRPAGRLARAR